MAGYLGRYMQGEVVPLLIQCRDGDGTPIMPNDPPVIRIFGSSGFVRQVQMPILDRYTQTAIFLYPLRLDGSFPADRYRATYFFKTTSGYYGLDIDIFEVLPGGDAEGAIVGMYWWLRPEATYLIEQTQAGSVLLRRNPTM